MPLPIIGRIDEDVNNLSLGQIQGYPAPPLGPDGEIVAIVGRLGSILKAVKQNPPVISRFKP
jgi:hypothetical protein